jgi:hypothetical protein
MRSALYVAWLAWRRVRRRESGALLAGVGLAIASAMLAGVLSGVTVAADRATSQEVERIPASSRGARAVWFGVPAGENESYGAIEGEVRDALEGLPLERPTALALFRESTVAGHFVGLAAVEGLARHVILRSGRLPKRCNVRRCEVLRLRGGGTLPNAPGLRLVEVGTATLRSRQLFGDFLEPTDNATADAELAPALRESGRYHHPAAAPLVVAEGIDTLTDSPILARTYRSYAWVWPLSAEDPRLWQIDELIERIERGRADLAARSGSFAVTAPDEELRAIERRAKVSGRRLLIVGAEIAALLLAFALLSARGLRRDVREAHRRLTWYGARTWQLALLTGVESAVVALGGVLVGWMLGSAAGALTAALSGAPPATVLAESVLSSGGLALLAGVALATTVATVAAVSLREREGARVGVPELAGLAAIVIAGVALFGGVADEGRLARAEGSATLLLLLPALAAFIAAIAVSKLFRPLARLAADRARGRPVLRLAWIGLARGPGAGAVTAAFLTIAFGLALLAEGYRGTLSRGERDQAAFQVPLDVVVREDLGALVRVFDAARLERFQALAGPDGDAYRVLRVTGGAGRAERVSGITVLGLDREVVERLSVWRREWASGAGRDELAAAIQPAEPVELEGIRLPSGDIAVRIGPSLVGLAAHVETPDGAFRRVELGEPDPNRPSTLAARVPRGSLLVALELVPPPRLVEGGADAGIAFDGRLRATGPLAGGLQRWIGFDGVEVQAAGTAVELRYVLTRQRTSLVRAAQATDRNRPSVLVTPALAELAGGTGGLLPMQLTAEEPVTARVAGVIERFPGTSEEVIVGDRTTLRTALNAAAPGTARENEVWLDVRDEHLAAVRAALSRPPFHVLASTLRADLESEAGRDPLAHGTLLALVAAALLALALAAVGLTLAVRSDLRDDRGELYELEAQGVSPTHLRRVVRARAVAVSLAGIVGGAVTGALLLTLVTRVVSVTARGGFAEPPLAITVDTAVVVAGVLAYVLLAVLLVGTATRRVFSEPRGPTRRSA